MEWPKALIAGIEGKKIRMKDSIAWSKVHQSGNDSTTMNKGLFLGNGSELWFPNETERQAEWEVEGERPVLYGACDDNGDSLVYSAKPKKEDGKWAWRGGTIQCMDIEQKNLFPKDKPKIIEI